MLTKQDKKWVQNTISKALAVQGEMLIKIFSEMLTKTVTKAIEDLRAELTQVMAEGFAECASSKDMAEVKANLGSLEQRFTWMHGAMVTKDYFDERMKDHTLPKSLIRKNYYPSKAVDCTLPSRFSSKMLSLTNYTYESKRTSSRIEAYVDNLLVTQVSTSK